MKVSTQWRIVAALSAAAILSNIIVVTSTAATFSQSKGLCFNGSSYTLTLARSGNKVESTMKVDRLKPNSLWNINYSFTPINTVYNTSARADKNGVLTVKRVTTTAKPLNVFIWVDAWGAAVSTCFAGATV